jgi:lipopolysaccharide transport system ATP-binding protein
MVIIKVENVFKQYRLGQIGTGTLSDDLNRLWYRIRGKEDPYLKIGEENDRTKGSSSQYVWALQDINFEVQPGEVLGIIGRNGAGKSTLLKILSRTTLPTKGEIRMKGRIASLLEVGTGFHPDLSGRDNIYLNGAILGMTKEEVRSKFDEIVDFAGIERYIDTPVKRYSSGMYVRLAFAVAAHLEPEILIVDEVLAVGDSEFQKKCLGKMKDVRDKEGRTILFVSHNMAAVRNLCTKGLILQNGKTVYSGDIQSAVNFYQKGHNTNQSFEHPGKLEEAPGNGKIRILKFGVEPLSGDVISVSSGISFEIVFYNYQAGINLDVTFELKNADEIVILHQGRIVSENKDSRRGVYTVKGTLPPNMLNAGNYYFNLIFGQDQKYPLFTISDFIQFEVMNEIYGNNSNMLPGIIRPHIDYSQAFEELPTPNHAATNDR